MKIKILLLFFFLYGFFFSKAQISLNEYSCSNLATTPDNYGEYEDWIELYNGGFNAASLSGYYLSDNIEDRLKWKIPSGVNIAGSGFLLVWASGRNEFKSGVLHASFKLTQSKKNPDWIILSDPSGNIIEKTVIQRQQVGHSMGKINASWQIYTTPTPGNSNNGPYKSAYAASPVFSKVPGFYPNSFRVYLTTTEPNSRIYYTTNGTNPLVGGIQYNSAGILIDSTRIIKAVTFSYNTNIFSSFITFGTFFINVNHTMPVVSIAGTDLNTLANGNSALKPDGSFEFFDKYKILKETAYGNFNSHGQDSWANDQRSLDYKTRDEMGYNDAIHEKLFSLSTRKDFQGIILRAAGDDNYPAAHHSSNAGSAHIRDAYVQNMAIQGGLDVDARTGEKAIVYLNGKYWGVYDMRERADEQDYTKYYYNQDKYNLQYIETWGTTWAQYGGNQALTDWGNLSTFIMNNNMAIPANYQYVTDNLDIKSLVDYAIVNSVSVCSDWLNYNTGWWRGLDPKGGHRKWGYTLWDNDAVFGFYINYTGIPSTAYTAPPCNIESSSLDDPEGHIQIILKLRQNPEFNQFYISRYIDLFNTTFSCNNMLYNLDSIITLLTPEMTQHANRWFGTFSEWSTNKTTLRNYVSNRCNYLSTGLNTCYNLNGPYLTTFKTIPANSGKLQINSMLFANLPYTGRYHGKIDVLLKAIPEKDYLFDYWTAGIDTFKTSTALANAILRIAGMDTIVAHFTPRTNYPKLNITEINYKSEPTMNSGSWFELTNYGNTAINLSGWKIIQGSWRTYVFPQGSIIGAGAHWVLASDSIRFNTIYRNTTFIKKYLAFDLSTINEALKLTDTSGTEFLSVSYDNNQPWPIAADGVGRTMELKNDSLNSALASNWRNGCVGGSPGASFQNCNEKFIVSEINYNSGQLIDAGTWFEILNTTNQNISLSDFRIRNKDFKTNYSIPVGTVLNANGRLVFCNDKIKFERYFPTQNVVELVNFSLGNSGDEIKIYDPADTLVFSVVYQDTLAFTKQANGTGYTLDYNYTSNDYSQGFNWSIACLGGSPNSIKGNCTGGIIFSEINYKSAPFNDAGDWFEIKNTSNSSINMRGWQFTDTTSGGFIINKNITLTPNAFVTLVSDTVKFKKMYPGVQNYIGNLNFNLNSSGEKLKIFDSLNNYISIVDYNDSLPWPAYVDGRGYTMELRYDTSDFHLGNKWVRGCLGGSPGASYSVCNDSVIIGEINYSSHLKADAGDWVEVWNKGAFAADISKWLFQDNDLKDTFLIPDNTILNSGARIVLVNDSNKFKAIFPAVKNFFGNFSFGLSSVTDQIVLRNSASKLKFGIVYTIDSTWDALAGGQGYTVELIKDSFDRSIGSYWKSKCPGGSPGSASGSCSESLVVTEINYKSDVIYNPGDWFELYNNGTVPVSLTAHYLANTDSSVKTILPLVPTLLFANEYIVLSNDTVSFNKHFPSVINKIQINYILKDTGDRIKIYDINRNMVASSTYSSSALWPALAYGKGFTLEHKNYSTGSNSYSDWDIGCYGGSPGGARQNCKTDLVISEINYNPQATEDDGQWIELKNTSASDTIHLQSYFVHVGSFNNNIPINKPVLLLPNSYFVIASDSLKFNRFHNGAVSDIMYYPFSLINTSSDELGIYNSNSKKIYHATYDASVSSLLPASGKGYTLEYIDTGKIYYSTANWFIGCRHGSPGKAYGSCVSPLRISEINYQSHPKFDMGHWFEIKNTADYAVDLSGWIVQNGNSSQRLKSNLMLPSHTCLLVADKLQTLKNNYNLSAILTDSLTLTFTSSDILSIRSSDSVWIYQIAYSNAAGWPKADGTSYTLEYSDTAATKYAIGCPGGSPGTDMKPCAAALEITEINYNSHQKNLSNDWLEIESKSKIPFTTDHWYVTINDSSTSRISDQFNLLFNGEKQVVFKSRTDFNKTHASINAIEDSKLALPDVQGTIKIYGTDNRLLDSVSYKNSSPWNSDANNTGRTLELINKNDNSIPQNWIAGCIGGTPATNYSAPCNYSIIVSEINHHPVVNYNSGDWAEIHNITGAAIDMSRMQVKTNTSTSVIPFATVIPANGYLVLTQNKSLFKNIFPAINNVLEISSLQIDDGDKIELYDSIGNINFYVQFDTLAPWPLNTTKGYTLEYKDTATNPWVAGNWFRSCFAGTPGRAYSLPCDVNGVQLNEESYHLSVFPNPNSGSFTVNTSFSGEAFIFDLSGREVARKKMDTGDNKVELNSSRGMYILAIFNGNEWVKKKIVIE